MLAIDKSIIQLKHCSRQIADRLLALLAKSGLFSGKRLRLVTMIAQFWASPNLNRIASPKQLTYVTYLLYRGLEICGPAAFSDGDQTELFEAVRAGIHERIAKVTGAEQD